MKRLARGSSFHVVESGIKITGTLLRRTPRCTTAATFLRLGHRCHDGNPADASIKGVARLFIRFTGYVVRDDEGDHLCLVERRWRKTRALCASSGRAHCSSAVMQAACGQYRLSVVTRRRMRFAFLNRACVFEFVLRGSREGDGRVRAPRVVKSAEDGAQQVLRLGFRRRHPSSLDRSARSFAPPRKTVVFQGEIARLATIARAKIYSF